METVNLTASFKRLKSEKYYDLRARYKPPSHYVYTACQMACSSYRGFRKLQAAIEYKAKLAGLNVKYVEAEGTSSLCPRCRDRLSPSGYRLMRCPRCDLEEDRDLIAVRNILQMYVPPSPVQGESPPMKGGGKA